MTKRKNKFKPRRSAKSQPAATTLRCAETLRDGTAIASNLLATEAAEITRALVRKAIAGNMKALRLCIERLVPFSRERALPVKIPAAQDALQITVALQAVFDGLRAGRLTASEAQKLAGLLENQRKAIETSDLEERLQALESSPPRREDKLTMPPDDLPYADDAVIRNEGDVDQEDLDQDDLEP